MTDGGDGRHVRHLRFSYEQRAATELLAVHLHRGLPLFMSHSLGGRNKILQ